jgi:Sld7 C-terminal domain
MRSQSTTNFLAKLETLPPRKPKARPPAKARGNVEAQTREAVRQITVAGLRMRGVECDPGTVSMTVNAGIFALRGKMKEGKPVGMGEIGDVVDSLLKIFLDRE